MAEFNDLAVTALVTVDAGEDQMRICPTASDWDPFRGAENQVALLMTHLAARGHETTLVVPGLDASPSDAGRAYMFSAAGLRDRGLRGVRAFTYRLPQLKRILRDLAADVYYIRGFSHLAPIFGDGRPRSRGLFVASACAVILTCNLRAEIQPRCRRSVYHRTLRW